MTNLMSERARRMRRDMSDAERRLWNKLRDLNGQGFHFRQQAPIGPYIAEVCCECLAAFGNPVPWDYKQQHAARL